MMLDIGKWNLEFKRRPACISVIFGSIEKNISVSLNEDADIDDVCRFISDEFGINDYSSKNLYFLEGSDGALLNHIEHIRERQHKQFFLKRGVDIAQELAHGLVKGQSSKAVAMSLRNLALAVRGNSWLADELIVTGAISLIVQVIEEEFHKELKVTESVELGVDALLALLKYEVAVEMIQSSTEPILTPAFLRTLVEALFSEHEIISGWRPVLWTLLYLLYRFPELCGPSVYAIFSGHDGGNALFLALINDVDSGDELACASAQVVLSALALAIRGDETILKQFPEELSKHLDVSSHEVFFDFLTERLLLVSLSQNAMLKEHGFSEKDIERLEHRVKQLEEENILLKQSVRQKEKAMSKMVPFLNLDSSVDKALPDIVRFGWDGIRWRKHYTLLHYIAECGEDPVVVELVASLATDLQSRDDSGWSPLDYATKQNRNAAVATVLERLCHEELLRKKVETQATIRQTRAGSVTSTRQWRTRLGSMKNLPEFLRDALDATICVGWDSMEWPDNFTSIHLAAHYGHKEDWGQTPMDYARRGCHNEVLALLEDAVDAHAEITTNTGSVGGTKPVHANRDSNFRETRCEFVKVVMAPETQKVFDCLGPELQRCVRAVLSKRWAKIIWPHDFTALHMAAHCGSTDGVKLLMEASASPGLLRKDDKGMLPIDYAKMKKFQDTEKALMSYIDGVDGRGPCSPSKGKGTKLGPVLLGAAGKGGEESKAVAESSGDKGGEASPPHFARGGDQPKGGTDPTLAKGLKGMGPPLAKGGGESKAVDKPHEGKGGEASPPQFARGGDQPKDGTDPSLAKGKAPSLAKGGGESKAVDKPHEGKGEKACTPHLGKGGDQPKGGTDLALATGSKGKAPPLAKGGGESKAVDKPHEGKGGKASSPLLGKGGDQPKGGADSALATSSKGKAPPLAKGALPCKGGGKGKQDVRDKQLVMSNIKCKRINWKKKYNFGVAGFPLKDQKDLSIWCNVRDMMDHIDRKAIEDNFAASVANNKCIFKQMDEAEKCEKTPRFLTNSNRDILVDSAFKVFVKQMPPVANLCRAIDELDESIVTEDLLNFLINNFKLKPTWIKELADMKAKYPTVPFAEQERYVWELGQIVGYEERLMAWAFVRTYEEDFHVCWSRLEATTKLLDCFRSSTVLPDFIGIFLAVGNYMNSHYPGQAQADGFRLHDLGEAFKITKDKMGKAVQTYAVEMFFTNFPEKAMRLLDELTPLWEQVARTSVSTDRITRKLLGTLDDCQDTLNALKTSVGRVESDCTALLSLIDDATCPFCLRVPPLIRKARHEVLKLEESFVSATKAYDSLLKYLGMDKVSAALDTDKDPKLETFAIFWDELLVPDDLVLKKPAQIRKRYFDPIFLKPVRPTYSNMMCLYNLRDPEGELSEQRKQAGLKENEGKGGARPKFAKMVTKTLVRSTSNFVSTLSNRARGRRVKATE